MDLREQMAIISTSSCRMTELYREWAKLHGMSYNTLMTLYAIHREGGCPQKRISEEWMIPKQTVNTVVKSLERRGLVSIGPGRDQKEKLVTFTPEGAAYAKEQLEPIMQVEDRVLRRMGRTRVQALVEITQFFVKALGEEVAHE